MNYKLNIAGTLCNTLNIKSTKFCRIFCILTSLIFFLAFSFSPLNADEYYTSTSASAASTISSIYFFNKLFLSVSIDPRSIVEGGTVTATVTRSPSDTTGDLAVYLTSYIPSDDIKPTTVIIPYGSTSATSTITTIDNSIMEGNRSVGIFAIAANHAHVFTTLHIIDDEDGFSVTPTSLSINEDEGTETFDLVLLNKPDSNVVFTVTSDNTAEATVSDTPITFTSENWNHPKTITVTGVDDAVNGNGVANIIVSVDDANSHAYFALLPDQTVSVTCIDDEPTAVDDTISVKKSSSVVINVIDNDFDPQDDTLTITSITSIPAEGTAVITDEGTTITYTSDVNFGTFPFDYSISDGNGGISEATVTIVVGEEVAYGLQFTIKANEVDSPLGGTMAEFTRKPLIYAHYTDPISKRKMKTKLKVKTKVPDKNRNSVSEVKSEWKRNIILYNKKELTSGYRNGTYTSSWLTTHPINPLTCVLQVKTYLPDRTKVNDILIKNLILSPPEITDIKKLDGTILGTDPLYTNSVIIIKGKYFGSRTPIVWMEYKNSYNRVRKKRLTVKRIYKYQNAHGKYRSCMDIKTGDSEIRVKMPRRWWRGWRSGTYDLVIYNKVGLTTTSVKTANDSCYYIHCESHMSRRYTR